MTTFQLRPVCVAVLALIAHAAACAQSGTGTPPSQPDQATLQDPASQSQSQPQDQVSPAAPTQPGQIVQVQVTGLRSSIRSAEAIKRNSDQVVDSINAEDIGKFPDRATGDALQRIAGVQVGQIGRAHV